MGQKVHPNGLRLGEGKNWLSRWFFTDKKQFRETLIQDIKIRKKLMKELSFAMVTQIDIERQINKITISIHAIKPGMIIGRGGKGLEDVKKHVTVALGKQEKGKEAKIDLKVEPVKKPYLNAYYVAQTVSDRLVRSVPHRGFVHNTLKKVMEAGAKGVKVQLGGRIGGAEIARREKYFEGSIPTSTIRADIDFARHPSLTRSGYVGVKVWISR